MGHRRIARGGRHRTAVGRLVRRPWRRRTDLDPTGRRVRDRLDRASVRSDRGQSAAITDSALRRRRCPGVVRRGAFVLLKLVSALVPLRVSREQQPEGLDISQHGEAVQWIPHPNTFFLPSGWAKLCPDSVLPMF